MPRRNGNGIDLLADPTRRRIIALLALGPLRPSKVAQEIGLSWPSTTRQLRLLQRAGLITTRRSYVDRRKVVYYIEPERLGQIAAWLVGTEVGRAFPRTPAATEPAVLLNPQLPTTLPLERKDRDQGR
jgi:DNA-binding transcriptional ArsR family regulator